MRKRAEMIRAIIQSAVARPGLLFAGWLLAVLLVTLWPFRFFGGNGVSVEEGHGVQFRPPATIYTPLPVSIPLGTHTWTMAMEIVPGPSGCDCPAVIVLWGLSRTNCNFMFGQEGENLEVSLGDRGLHMFIPDVLPPGKRSQLVIVADTDSTRCFINGTTRGAVPTRRSQWADSVSSPIVFGSDAHGKEHWEGEICNFGVFDGTMRPEDVFRTMQMPDSGSAIILYRFGLAHNGRIVNQGGASKADLVIPDSFVPYRRAFLQEPRGYLWGGIQGDSGHILSNIIMFIPGGYFLTLVLARKGMSRKAGCWGVVFVLFLLTAGIEVLQAFLPSRDSGWMDVISNTIGAMVGAFGAQVIDAVLGRLMRMLQVRPVD
jgi:hypothetical protein